MAVTVSTMTLPGALLGEENPLPMFRAPNDRLAVGADGLNGDDLIGLGLHAATRVLPYAMQDRYIRSDEPVELKTLVLENERLRATFLPDWGGRLYSLFDKGLGRELLYVNPVHRPANLAIRNAWFSGGIEWNAGRMGHTPLTCAPVFFFAFPGDDGFLRMAQYERTSRLFVQIDFHLPPGAEQLAAYVLIQNTADRPAPLYWWTNTAVCEDRGARVLSASDEVICLDPVSFLGSKRPTLKRGRMPFLETLNGADASYPASHPFQNELFFQNPSTPEGCWEAVSYEDDLLFYERSGVELWARKLFCWGNHAGARRWQDYLSRPGERPYMEMQAGLAPTQLHGRELPPRSSVGFLQLFGGCSLSHRGLTGDWAAACRRAYKRVDRLIPAGRMLELERQYAQTALERAPALLHNGEGWAALEELRQPGFTPAQLAFPIESMSRSVRLWAGLLQADEWAAKEGWTAGHLTDPEWTPILEAACARHPEQGSLWYHLGVNRYENGCPNEAAAAWNRALVCAPAAAPALYGLARQAWDAGKPRRSLGLLEWAMAAADDLTMRRALCEEYLKALTRLGWHRKAWRWYRALPEALANGDRLTLLAAESALSLGKERFLERVLSREFAVVREGETSLSDLWERRAARKRAKASGETPERALAAVRESGALPAELDYRPIHPALPLARDILQGK